jgi:glycosyltransferase involved in cell wall biosynthesis
MKIAFFADNSQLPSVDFSTPDIGSPGVGASLYTQIAVPFFMKNYMSNVSDFLILAPNVKKMPQNIQSIHAEDVKKAAKIAKSEGADYFVFRVRQRDVDDIYSFIDEIKMPSIGVGQLTPFPATICKMGKSKYFKSLVCVGREQYDFLMDSRIWRKLSYIDNGVHLESCVSNIDVTASVEEKDPNLVVYMGALVPVKGFHVLAQAWPKVLEKFPDAKLSVIGSVKVYGDNFFVGPLGIAETSYEEQHIIPYLCDKKGQLDPSVTFHGQLGQEKFEIMNKASVGIVNPTGNSETCCVSAVEMSACKLPVVTGAYYALLDTVWHNQTGLLGRGVDELSENICKCLGDQTLVERLGRAGYQRVQEQYDFGVVVRRWYDLFQALEKGTVPEVSGRLKNWKYHYKILRIINCSFQKSFGNFLSWPSVFEIQDFIYKKLMKLKSLKQKSLG